VLAVLATVLPPFGWIVLISLFYDSFRSSPVVDAILRSMQPAVAAVILFAAVDMFKPLVKKKRLSIWILFLAALGIGLYGVNIIWILIGGGIIGACLSALGGKRHAR
jgi:chromate transporter